MRITHEMVSAFQAGVMEYQPHLPGLALEPETGDPAATTRNLVALVETGRPILAVIGGSRGVLIVFMTGETYLATGFASDSPELARFLVEHSNGQWTADYDEMRSHLRDWPKDLVGPIPLKR